MKMNKNTSLAVKGAQFTACLIQIGRLGMEMGQILDYQTLPASFANLVFWFDHSFYLNLKNPEWPSGALKLPTGSGKVYP